MHAVNEAIGAHSHAAIGLLRRLLSAWALVVLLPLTVLLLDGDAFADVVRLAATSFLGTLPYIAIAVVTIAVLKAANADATLAAAFEGQEVRMIIVAALIGGLAPFCSCEVIPFIAGLLAMGAPLSAIMAFWLSSPLIDPPTLFITAGALGWDFAIGKAVAAVGTGLAGGFSVALLTRQGLFASSLRSSARNSSGCPADEVETRPRWKFWNEAEGRAVFASQATSNSLFLAKWLSVAYVFEALLVTYVPASFVASLVGGSEFSSIVVATLVGIPAYLNGYVAPPLISGLIDQGMVPGAGMAFMVAGAISCVPAMIAVWSIVRPAVFATYLGLGLVCAILSGLVFQMLV